MVIFVSVFRLVQLLGTLRGDFHEKNWEDKTTDFLSQALVA